MPEMSQEKSQDKGVPEPSMEEILSSIRRIIADEDKGPDAGGTEPDAAAAQGDVLELTKVAEEDAMDESLVVAEPEPATPAPIPAAGAPRPGAEPASAATGVEDASLVSAKAAAASMSAFAKLAKPTAPESPPSVASSLTVEALVVQLLKPALREWLDQNLPPLVERIVEQEVRKLARRAELS
jgi:cell pole-organizing protein PopZ